MLIVKLYKTQKWVSNIYPPCSLCRKTCINYILCSQFQIAPYILKNRQKW